MTVSRSGNEREKHFAATTDERTVWMRSWAEGWPENLKDRPAERYYADLALEVACEMILELTEKA